MKNVIAPKAYRNEAFLASEGARNIRILCECTESQQRLTEHGVSATVLFFGSARAKSKEHHAALVSENEAKLCTARADNNADDIAALEKRADELERSKWMTEYFSKVEELSKAITEWAMSPDVKLGPEHKTTGVTRYHDHIAALNMTSPPMSDENSVNFEDTDCLSITQAIVVFTGGGPGFMEAANKGASEIPGACTGGMGITLPFETGLNPFVTPELAFEYHYFFTRKLWMLFYCQALVVAPGGVGTLDELFEVLTLRQTGKIQKELPVVLIGREYWETIVNWKALVKYGVLNANDISDLFITDDVDDAFNFLTDKLTFQKAAAYDFTNSVSMASILQD